MQEQNPKKKSPLFERLERLRQTQELTWDQVSEKLGVSVAMLMMVKAGNRNLSEKVLARLELSEVEAGLKLRSDLGPHAKAISGRQNSAAQIVTEADIKKGYLDFRPKYRSGSKISLPPETIRLVRPDSAGRTRLGIVVAKSFDSDIVLLASLPDEFRNQAFLENLTPSSRTELHNAALALVFGHEWRTTIARLAVEGSIGDRTSIDQILGSRPSSQS